MIVPNPCNPDYRVVKQAETLARAGYEIRVYCAVVKPTNAKDEEIENAVKYIRRAWSPTQTLKASVLSRLLFWKSPPQAPSPSSYFKTIINHGTEVAGERVSLDQQISPIKAMLILRFKWIFRKYIFKHLVYHSFRFVFEEEIRKWAPDVIHAHDGISLPLAAKLASKLNAKLIYDSHELETHRTPPLSWAVKKHVQFIEKSYLIKAYQVITVSQKIADYLQNSYGIKRPIVIYNSPPKFPKTQLFDETINPRTDVRNETSVGSNKKLLVYTGNITINRGLEQTVDAISEFNKDLKLVEEFGEIYFAIVGKGTEEVKNLILKRIMKKGIQGNVFFLDPVPPTDVSRYISTASVSVIPIIPASLSYEYAMPNKFFEAMLAKLPILGSKIYEMSIQIEKHSLGVSFTPGNSSEFITGLVDILRNRGKYIGSGRQTAIDNFCWEQQEVKLLAIYDGL